MSNQTSMLQHPSWGFPLFVLAIVGPPMLFLFVGQLFEKAEKTANKIKITEESVHELTNQLDVPNPDGLFKQEYPAAKDAWGRLLLVEYQQEKKRNAVVQTLVVTSRGPDGEVGTEDDIILTRKRTQIIVTN